MCGRNFSIISKTEILHYTSWNTFKYIFKLTKRQIFAKNQNFTYLSVFHGYKVLMK